MTNEISSIDSNLIKQYASSDGVLTIYSRRELPREGVTVIIKDAEGNTHSEKNYDTTDISVSINPSNLNLIKQSKYTISDNRETIDEISYTFDGWTIDGGMFADGTTGPINSNTLEIQASSGSIVTLNPHFKETTITYYKLTLSVSLKSGLTGTSCTISFAECLQIIDSGVLKHLSQTVNNTSDSIYYLRSGSIVSLSYEGYNGLFINTNVKIKFSGFDNNSPIDTNLKDSTERTLEGIATITVSY